MCPKDHQDRPATDPARTPDQAEGSEQAVDGALRAQGLSTGDKNQRVGESGKSTAGDEPNSTPGKAEG